MPSLYVWNICVLCKSSSHFGPYLQGKVRRWWPAYELSLPRKNVTHQQITNGSHMKILISVIHVHQTVPTTCLILTMSLPAFAAFGKVSQYVDLCWHLSPAIPHWLMKPSLDLTSNSPTNSQVFFFTHNELTCFIQYLTFFPAKSVWNQWEVTRLSKPMKNYCDKSWHFLQVVKFITKTCKLLSLSSEKLLKLLFCSSMETCT